MTFSHLPQPVQASPCTVAESAGVSAGAMRDPAQRHGLYLIFGIRGSKRRSAAP